MSKAQPISSTERLAQLRETEHRAKVASNQAEREALLARNAAEEAEQNVVRAHAGHGTLDKAEQQLTEAEANARNVTLKAQGAALHYQEVQVELRRFHGSHSSDLIAEAEVGAAKPCQVILEGVRLIVEGDALWKAQAREIDGHSSSPATSRPRT